MQAGSEMASQRFCLRWNNHQTNLLSVFDQLLHDQAFVDVTLAVEGQFLKAHKMVLSACSPYFQALFVGHPDKHPIVILKDVPYSDMRSLLDFMYRGEVSVDQDRLTAFLKVAESLRIKGLTEVNEERCDLPSIANSLLNQTFSPPPPPPPPNLHRLPVPPPLPTGPGKPQVRPPPPPPNPMLNSALTAPKRKRGRPRKLSGSSPNPPSLPHSELDHEEPKHQPPGNTNSIENHLGMQYPALSVQAHHHPPLPAHPPELGVPFGSCLPPGVPPSAPPPSSNPPAGEELNSSPKMEEEDEEDCEELGKMEDGDEDGEEDEPPDLPLHPIKSEDPKPGTSAQDTLTSFQSSAQSDGEKFSSSGQKNQFDSGFLEADEDSLQTGMMGSLEDMITCSPAGSSEGEEGVEMFSSQSMAPEFADEEISQLEEDSLRSLMGRPSVESGEGGRRRMDKMSIRKFCTREGDQIHRCTICSKAYTHISNFCRHFLSAHCGTKQEIHCPVCHKPFTRKDNMMTHAKQVHGYSCMRNMMTDQLPTYDQQATE